MQADPDFVWLTICGICAYIFIYRPSDGSLTKADPGLLEEAPPELLGAIRKRQREIYLSRARN